MKNLMNRSFTVFLFAAVPTLAAAASFPWETPPKPDPTSRPTPENPAGPQAKLPACEPALRSPAYRELAKAMSHLDRDGRVRAQLKDVGLDITTVSWQDTGRSHNSSGGSNISDVRLVAVTQNDRGVDEYHAQPIVRLPNFEDKTVDVDMDSVMLPAGNAWGVTPYAVSLQVLLENLPNYLSWREVLKGSLFAPERDREVLVSAQATIMPVPTNGKAHFVPSIFNYQSTKENPAVLVILVSNRGTSITLIDNARDPVSAQGLGKSRSAPFPQRQRSEKNVHRRSAERGHAERSRT